MKTRYLYLGVGTIMAVALFIGCGTPSIKIATNVYAQFDIAKKEYDQKHYLKAIQGFQRVVFNFPGATIVDTAQYYLAMSYYENHEYELASVEFNRLITNYPQSAFADDAQFLAGVCMYKATPKHYGLDQEELTKAIKALEDFITDNPDSPRLDEARGVINEARTRLAKKQYQNGLLYWKMGNYEAARIYFQLVVDEYTDTQFASFSLFKLGEILSKQSKYAEALAKFNNFITIYPSSNLVPEAQKMIEQLSRKTDSADVSGSAK
ncbi:Outer membrane assembly lipoprotein YfiO [Candidatus Zixiibacteriota bacterium]|nr:Outer membrane assembly lipoprotein YfiO [candidate division Zixibacteria bacterium]